MKPHELVNLAHELKTQNNRCTQHPLFLVQQEKRIYGMDSAYADHSEWVDDEGEICGGTDSVRENIRDEAKIEESALPIDPADHGYTRVWYTSYWDFVTAHLTEKAAQRYLNENAHNLSNPRVYVSSQYRCDEWIAVVEHLRGCERHCPLVLDLMTPEEVFAQFPEMSAEAREAFMRAFNSSYQHVSDILRTKGLTK